MSGGKPSSNNDRTEGVVDGDFGPRGCIVFVIRADEEQVRSEQSVTETLLKPNHGHTSQWILLRMRWYDYCRRTGAKSVRQLLRGTIVNRTSSTHKNLPGTWYIFAHFYQHFLVLFTMVPRDTAAQTVPLNVRKSESLRFSLLLINVSKV